MSAAVRRLRTTAQPSGGGSVASGEGAPAGTEPQWTRRTRCLRDLWHHGPFVVEAGIVQLSTPTADPGDPWAAALEFYRGILQLGSMHRSGEAAPSGDVPSLDLTREQTRAARALLGLSQLALATRAGVQRRVLIDFENGVSIPHRRTALAIRTVLEEAGVRFLTRHDGGIGVVLTRDGLDRLYGSTSDPA